MINNKLIKTEKVNTDDFIVAKNGYTILRNEFNIHKIGNNYFGVISILKDNGNFDGTSNVIANLKLELDGVYNYWGVIAPEWNIPTAWAYVFLERNGDIYVGAEKGNLVKIVINIVEKS